MRGILALCLWLALLAAVGAQERGAAPATAERRVALVVGNGGYRHAAGLANPANDARGMAAKLRAVGFEVLEAVDADQQQLRAALARFARRLEGARVGLLFYAGHGLQIAGQNYLLPIDARLEREADLYLEAVALADVLRILEATVPTRLVLLDACRDNPLGRGLAHALGAARGQGVGQGLARIEAAVGTLIAYATAPGETAADGVGEHSPFTGALLEHLATPGLEVGQLLRRVRATVLERTGGRQVTWDSSSLVEGEFYFVPAPAPAAEAPERLEAALGLGREDRAAVQRALAALGFDPRGTDGELGPRSRSAIASWQVARGEAATGYLTPAQHGRLLAEAAAWAAPAAPGGVFRDCPACPEMVVVPAGRFEMGSTAAERGWLLGQGWADKDIQDEQPRHAVVIERPFALGRQEVTVGQFRTFVERAGHRPGPGCRVWNGKGWTADPARSWHEPGFPQTDEHPVICVSWDDAQAYAGWLARETGHAYRLLSEAEWEYAARGRTAASTAMRHWGEDRGATEACLYANGADRTGREVYGYRRVFDCRDGAVHTAPTGRYRPNGFGLHDMLGNAWEWVEDCYRDGYAGAPVDGGAWPADGPCGVRGARGGGWGNSPEVLRSANRGRFTARFRYENLGFRVARPWGP